MTSSVVYSYHLFSVRLSVWQVNALQTARRQADFIFSRCFWVGGSFTGITVEVRGTDLREKAGHVRCIQKRLKIHTYDCTYTLVIAADLVASLLHLGCRRSFIGKVDRTIR
ncbi:hypothetical protein EYF80_009553 [Liparis tanakae]|uniref:Uncharacterized protein n=1 Tax=Liparis tanakae TaxID=230148 RepID=A0A4Z2IRJ0_9TELE|nr:hypothetical protein EYF80_009553 [Liparis tanakae]